MQAGLTVILESLMITKESWGVGKIVWSDQIFFIFCIKHWANNSRQEFCFLWIFWPDCSPPYLQVKWLAPQKGKHDTQQLLQGHGYLPFLSFFVHGQGDNSRLNCVTSRLIITKFHYAEEEKVSWS